VKVLYKLALSSFLLVQAGLCYSSESINLILLPDLSSCHQVGGEIGINENSSLGILGRAGCESNRATYGNENDDVENKFSRILVPWRYSFNGVFKDGYFIQALSGVEKSEFKSTLGSTADVTFATLAVHGGYQWFWSNGFNISLMAGVAYLHEVSSSNRIVSGEEGNVTDFLDKNTKTNIHGGAGFFIGWLF